MKPLNEGELELILNGLWLLREAQPKKVDQIMDLIKIFSDEFNEAQTWAFIIERAQRYAPKEPSSMSFEAVVGRIMAKTPADFDGKRVDKAD